MILKKRRMSGDLTSWKLLSDPNCKTLSFGKTIHYIYRALVHPYLNPSMSPIHPLVWIMAVCFNVVNGLSLGGWLAGYGPVRAADWAGRIHYVEIGMVIWAWGLMANMYHDDDLREIRRAAGRRMRKMRKEEDEGAKGEDGKGDAKVEKRQDGSVDKVYMLPKNGLFHFVLYAHFLCEWVEWLGFWVVGGWSCVPARAFLVNEIATMLPRALHGWQWYVDKFGRDKVGSRKAIIPGLL